MKTTGTTRAYNFRRYIRVAEDRGGGVACGHVRLWSYKVHGRCRRCCRIRQSLLARRHYVNKPRTYTRSWWDGAQKKKQNNKWEKQKQKIYFKNQRIFLGLLSKKTRYSPDKFRFVVAFLSIYSHGRTVKDRRKRAQLYIDVNGGMEVGNDGREGERGRTGEKACNKYVKRYILAKCILFGRDIWIGRGKSAAGRAERCWT